MSARKSRPVRSLRRLCWHMRQLKGWFLQENDIRIRACQISDNPKLPSVGCCCLITAIVLKLGGPYFAPPFFYAAACFLSLSQGMVDQIATCADNSHTDGDRRRSKIRAQLLKAARLQERAA